MTIPFVAGTSGLDHGQLGGLADDDHPQYAAAGHSHSTDWGEAGDIAPLGTAAAGSTGEVADAGHVHPHTETINFIIDGGGAVITTGVKGDLWFDFAFKVVAWRIFSDVSGSIVVDIWADTYANFPPTNADAITTSEKPTLSSASRNQDTSLNSGNGWSVAADRVLRFNVDSVSTVTRVTVALEIVRT